MLSRSDLFVQFYLMLLLFCSCQQQTEKNYTIEQNFKVRDYVKEDKLPAVLACNIAFDKFSHKKEFPYFIKISSEYKAKGESMYPTVGELRRLDSLESVTEALLKDAGVQEFYVFRETHNGTRDFYLVTNDKDAAAKALDAFQKKSVSPPFRYTIITDPNWNTYEATKKTLTKE